VLRDEVKVFVSAGNGGNGSLHFRREKYVPRGGPDGGDAGRGGSVFVQSDKALNTLYRYARERRFLAEGGGHGAGRQKHGKAGEDLTLYVPVGTVVRDAESGDVLGDLEEHGASIMVARGGRGGLGNMHFATATRQAPRIAEKGEPGQERWLLFELKLIADVGIVGLPNAGKSTLLSRISAARPKVADYPFTTLSPNLGVVTVDEDQLFVAADIPGLIEGAHVGAGLGHEFLRHVERTLVFIHVLDGAAGDAGDIVRAFDTINQELELYQEGLSRRPMVVAINKADLPQARANAPEIQRQLGRRGFNVHLISGVTGEGINTLLRDVWTVLEEARAVRAAQPPELPVVALEQPDIVEVEPVDDGFVVHSRRAARAVAMTDVDQPEGWERLQELLRRFGVTRALEQAGVEPGDAVYIGDTQLIWGE
jgi:GTP-binding protein